jgi:SP family myo-inositol transporter-like MFS transporter 13
MIFKLINVASIGGFMFGYDTSCVSGAQLFFKDDFPDITVKEVSLIVSLAQLGAFIGSLAAGPMQDKFGRKPIIMVSDVIFTLGAALMYFAPSIPFLMAGRLIVGLGIGISALVIPVYISEIAPVHLRGTLMSINILFLTTGQFVAGIISLLLGNNWRLMLGLSGVPSLL